MTFVPEPDPLFEVIDSVLARYFNPKLHLSQMMLVAQADRGDLASDIGSAVKRFYSLQEGRDSGT